MKKIRIVSPAKSIEAKHIDFAEGWLRSKGYDVEISAHAKGREHYFSGSVEDRLNDMQTALDDPTIDAILCSRGGYGCVQFVDQLDWREFLRYPKHIYGYSDVTVLHNRMHKMGFHSVHSTAPLNFEENTEASLESLLNALEGKSNSYHLPAHSLNRSGDINGKMIGGNLSILCSLVGTNDELDTKGKILFIEDIGEAVYAVDRMMWQLKKSKALKGLDGLIVGGMTAMKDSEHPYGKSVDEVIRAAVEEYDFPLCFNFPSGHIDDNRALVFGKKASLTITDSGSIFKQ